jgi:signal transduction histidine kinase
MKVFDHGVVWDYPLEIQHKEGKITPVMYNATVYRDESGNVKGVFAAARDITERKRAEESLHLANKKLTLLTSITRHDINNQLTVLMGFLTILKKKQPDPALNEYFVKVSAAAQRISSMIKFTKEYDNIGVNAPVWQDCHKLVDTAAKEAPLGKIMVKNDFPAGAEVFADPLIVKVFYNLMDNAVRYGGKITTIRFSVEAAGDDHLIVCEDDGDGVVAGEKEKIFERGFGKNTGLGLALSREILSITGITIKETGEPGKGARFEMTVPKGAYRLGIKPE